MEAIEREQHSGLLQSFVVPHHGGNGLGVGHGAGLGLLVSLGDHQHHESHWNCLLLIFLVFSSLRFGAGVSGLSRSAEPQLPTLTLNEGLQIDIYSTFFGKYLLSVGHLHPDAFSDLDDLRDYIAEKKPD